MREHWVFWHRILGWPVLFGILFALAVGSVGATRGMAKGPIISTGQDNANTNPKK